MTDPRHLPFIAAIKERPDDDLRRLVYADWLEDHELDAQAEMIRYGVENPKHAGGCYGDASVGQFCANPANECPCCEAVREWGLLPPAMLGEGNYLLRRGFVEEVSCTFPAWVRHHAHVLEMNPLKAVEFRQVYPTFVYEHEQSPTGQTAQYVKLVEMQAIWAGRQRLGTVLPALRAEDSWNNHDRLCLDLLRAEWPGVRFKFQILPQYRQWDEGRWPQVGFTATNNHTIGHIIQSGGVPREVFLGEGGYAVPNYSDMLRVRNPRAFYRGTL